MNRISAHALLFIVTICLALAAVWQYQLLHEQDKLTKALAQIPAIASTSDPVPEAVKTSDHARLAWANALSAGNELSAAESIYAELIDKQPDSDIAQAADFNLSNAYLREGTKTSLSGNRRRAMLGLAKQRYRDLLQRTPDDWEIRYNLERALRLAPEVAGLRDAKGPPINSVDVVVPDFMLRALP